MRTLAYLSSLWVTIQAYSEYAADVETVEFDKWTVDPPGSRAGAFTSNPSMYRYYVVIFGKF